MFFFFGNHIHVRLKQFQLLIHEKVVEFVKVFEPKIYMTISIINNRRKKKMVFNRYRWGFFWREFWSANFDQIYIYIDGSRFFFYGNFHRQILIRHISMAKKPQKQLLPHVLFLSFASNAQNCHFFFFKLSDKCNKKKQHFMLSSFRRRRLEK